MPAMIFAKATSVTVFRKWRKSLNKIEKTQVALTLMAEQKKFITQPKMYGVIS